MGDAPSRALGVGGWLSTPGQGGTSSMAKYRTTTGQQALQSVPTWCNRKPNGGEY